MFFTFFGFFIYVTLASIFIKYIDNADYRENHVCVCHRSPDSPTGEDGYFRGDKRVTVEEVTK